MIGRQIAKTECPAPIKQTYELFYIELLYANIFYCQESFLKNGLFTERQKS